jgi:2-polyprenyl-3-methyl-5-hydroxy-6-metoxy-1,4-benzoquinol methylase
MSDTARAHFREFPTPGPAEVPVGPGQLDRLDDSLHFGWAWHRYKYCYRRNEGLRILDAGCGTGVSTLGLARLNRGSTVVGIDASGPALTVAQSRAEAADEGPRVSFLEHDLEERLPTDLGRFDFIVCRGVLGHASHPVRVLENLACILESRGLLVATFPTRGGVAAIRQFRRALAALCPADMPLRDRAELGLELFRSLRPDHPIRRLEFRYSGPNGPHTERLVSAYLGPEPREWVLEEAVADTEAAGLRFLYAAAYAPWSADRAFAPAVPEGLKARISALGEREQAVLVDALDPSMHLDEYRVHACSAEFEPRLPSWPEELQKHPEVVERLVPHVTGLAWPAEPGAAPLPGRPPVYAAVTGALGPIDPAADALFRAVDGVLTCGEIDRLVRGRTGVMQPPGGDSGRWLDLANFGFLTLESTDPREHVDCVHLGPVRDRLECPCPRRWIRACERHGFCSIDPVRPGDPQFPAFEAALKRLDITSLISCSRCPDYVAEEPLAPVGP